MGFPINLQVLNDRGRDCGSCTACCRTLSIQDGFVSKPERVHCEHVCEQGCQVYDIRPNTCRNFICLWRSGHLEGDDRRRPDQLGLMLHMTQTRFGDHVMCWELKPNAVKDNRYLLDKIATKKLVLVMLLNEKDPQLPGQRMFIGPPQDMVRVDEFKSFNNVSPV
jgi:hypothetical protein